MVHYYSNQKRLKLFIRLSNCFLVLDYFTQIIVSLKTSQRTWGLCLVNTVLSTVMQQIHLNKLRPWPANVPQLLSTGNPEVSEQDGWDHEAVVEVLARAVTIWRLYRGWTCLHFFSMLWQPTSSSELIQKEKERHGLAVAPTNSAAVDDLNKVKPIHMS